MIRSLSIAIIAFSVGALVALVVRTALHHPHAVMIPAPATTQAAAPMTHAEPSPAVVAPIAPVMTPVGQNVNTICPVCGMPVRTSISPATWKGHVIGFGCSTCPDDFAEKPDFYGAAALTNVKAQ